MKVRAIFTGLQVNHLRSHIIPMTRPKSIIWESMPIRPNKLDLVCIKVWYFSWIRMIPLNRPKKAQLESRPIGPHKLNLVIRDVRYLIISGWYEKLILYPWKCKKSMYSPMCPTSWIWLLHRRVIHFLNRDDTKILNHTNEKARKT